MDETDSVESLDSVLSGTPQADAPAPDAVDTGGKPDPAAPAPAPDKGPARDEHGKFAKAQQTGDAPADAPSDPAAAPAAPVPAEKQPLKPANVAAILDERRRRQQAERELEQLRAQAATPPPSVFENEDAAIAARVNSALAPMQQRFFQQSVRLARMTHGESYAEAEAAFAQAAQDDPRLIEAWRNADDPGEFIYTTGLQIRELSDVGGDFVKYREKVTAGHSQALAERDTRIAALTAEIESLKKSQADLNSLSKSLNQRPTGSAPRVEELDDEPLSKIARFGNT
jgi:hypothetical protein